MSKQHESDNIEALFDKYGTNYRWFVTATVMLGTISTVLTSTSVNVALPDIMGAFGMGRDTVQLLSTGFLAAMTGTMLINAWMVESFGQRITYIFATSIFLIASIMGGLAPNQNMLIFARILQGAAAGILQPLSMQVIFQVFPPENRGSAMGLYSLGIVLAPTFGPTVGGIMVDSFSWRYVFFPGIPFSLLGIFLASLFMPERTSEEPIKRFDWIGFGLMILFLVTLLNGLSNGQHYGWMSTIIQSNLTIALIAFISFLFWELFHSDPMLNLRLFTIRSFVGASLVALIFGAGNYSSTYLVPLFVQTIQGYTPTMSGLLLMPAGLISALIFPISGLLADKIPSHIMIMIGLTLFAASSFLMTNVDTQTSFWLFASWIAFGRIGLGLIIPSLNAGALRTLPANWIGAGSGTINFIRQLGGAFGVNLLSIFLEHRSQLYSHSFTVCQTASNGTTNELLHGVTSLYAQIGIPEAIRQAGALNYLGRMIYAQSNMMGYRDGFMAITIIFLIALLPAFIMRRRTHPQDIVT